MTPEPTHLRSRLAAFVVAIAMMISSSACEKAAEVGNPRSYVKDGISFSYASNWAVSEDVTEDGFRYLFVESPGDSIFILHVYLDGHDMDLGEYARWFSDEMKADFPIGTPGESIFTPTERETGVGRLEGLVEEMPVTFLGERVDQKHEYYRFEAGKKVVYLIASAPAEDLGMVSPGFDLIFRDFRIEYREPEAEVVGPPTDEIETPETSPNALGERIRKHRDANE